MIDIRTISCCVLFSNMLCLIGLRLMSSVPSTTLCLSIILNLLDSKHPKGVEGGGAVIIIIVIPQHPILAAFPVYLYSKHTKGVEGGGGVIITIVIPQHPILAPFLTPCIPSIQRVSREGGRGGSAIPRTRKSDLKIRTESLNGCPRYYVIWSQMGSYVPDGALGMHGGRVCLNLGPRACIFDTEYVYMRYGVISSGEFRFN